MPQHQELMAEDTNNVLADSILLEIEEPLLNSSSNCCIFRVPDKLRAVKEDAYVPEIVSIGPFHHGKPNLQLMEQHKKRYLQAFLSRITTTTTTSSPSPSSSLEYSKSNLLKDLIKSLRELETEARECYKGIINLNSDEFVQMMLLDGCFIIEFLHRNYDYTNNSGPGISLPNDQIFSTTWMVISVERDLVLLENQIPFVVLDTIFSFTACRDPANGNQSLDELVDSCFYFMLPTVRFQAPPEDIPQVDEEISENPVELLSFSSNNKPKHILDLLYSYLLPLSQQLKKVEDVENNLGELSEVSEHCCVNDLWEAGVTFKLKKDSSLNVQFNDKDAIFEMPFLRFDERAIVFLRNLVAMEQYDSNSMQLVSSYVALICRLIKSEKDVRLLRYQGIVENHWRNDQEMVVKINSLKKEVITSNFYRELYHRCNKYLMKCTRGRKWSAMFKRDYFNFKWKEWKQMLKRDYFNSPWALLKFIAAVILLILAFLQTFYAMYAYHRPSSS